MPTKRYTDVDTEKAMELKQLGLTYKGISKVLNVSVDWCKKNLKETKLDNTELIDKLVKQARQSEALTNGELFNEVSKNFEGTKTMSKSELKEEVLRKYKNTRSKVLREDSTIIRPTWMLPFSAMSSFHKVAELTEQLDGILDELLNDYYRTFDIHRTEQLDKGLLSTLNRLSKFSSVTNNSNSVSLIDSYEQVAQNLVERNGDKGVADVHKEFSCVIDNKDIVY